MWYSISWLVYEVLALQLTSRLNLAVPEVTKEQRVIVDVAKYVKRCDARIGNGLLEGCREF